MNTIQFYYDNYCLFVLDIENLKYYQQGNFINYEDKEFQIYKIITNVVKTPNGNVKTNSVSITLK